MFLLALYTSCSTYPLGRSKAPLGVCLEALAVFVRLVDGFHVLDDRIEAG